MYTTKRSISLEKLQKVAMVLKTIGHPVRLEILEALEEEEPLSVATIKERMETQVEQSLLSHHLIKMKDKGILSSFKQGKQVFYHLADKQVLKIFDCMENCSLV